MRYVVLVVAILAALAAVGYSSGWWDGSVNADSRSVSAKMSVDTDEIAADRDKFVADTQKKLDELDAKFARLTADAKAELKPKYDAIKQGLAKRREQLAESLQAAKTATKEKWQDVRSRAETAWGELSDGFAKALEEIQK